jgi:hypothetical protein
MGMRIHFTAVAMTDDHTMGACYDVLPLLARGQGGASGR